MRLKSKDSKKISFINFAWKPCYFTCAIILYNLISTVIFQIKILAARCPIKIIAITPITPNSTKNCWKISIICPISNLSRRKKMIFQTIKFRWLFSLVEIIAPLSWLDLRMIHLLWPNASVLSIISTQGSLLLWPAIFEICSSTLSQPIIRKIWVIRFKKIKIILTTNKTVIS